MNLIRFLQRLLATTAVALCVAGLAYATPSPSEQKVIETLIERVADHKSMKFMRNGEEHDAAEAARHLRAKYDHFKDKIVTAEDFIRLCGTRSEVTKVPYKVRTANKGTRNSADFLHEELRQVRRQAKV
ncbi:hypothetical protein C7T35_05375 [Variovorax sp. WS11]|uniref:DUF5329 family protein n=1 Tax=Variovorax sp. WS11 TaxID=1105204 RepID=UPI000D0DFFFA|nr:DUF5329 family protein [Variovorax sp. WS11]NDZ14766.1 DUF5329 domain-containing protein [Variovorax sp. WS11]PSL85711.1 hypothetical protein C7T35_05375 [Variovorax sp. WS11]